MAKRETKAERAVRVQKILEALDREYGTEYRCYLNHETPWQLLSGSHYECSVYRCQSQHCDGRPV